MAHGTQFEDDSCVTERQKLARAKVLKAGIEQDDYEIDDSFRPASSVEGAHTLAELIHFAEHNQTIQIDCKALVQTRDGYTHQRFNKKRLIETFKKNQRSVSFREDDAFNTTNDSNLGTGGISDDFIPLIGGPYSKQLYYDYIRMHALAFHAFHHDPVARAVINLTKEFTLGRGFRVDCKNAAALALWRAFEEANDLQALMRYAALELSLYGEVMLWELPNLQTHISYQPLPGQAPPKGLLPRVRLVDPSTVWEIITMPEDINQVLGYQQIFSTQYSMYQGELGGKAVPNSKFIVQQIPAEQIDHFKINCVSNEKRGRSDLFPVFGYLKRLRDSTHYALIAAQKASAWAMDTTIQGGQADLDSYVAEQMAIGTFAPPGSEFVHTDKITRTYLGNQMGGKGFASPAFEWNLSMVCAGVGIPFNYLGTHLAAGSSRASSIVATEPVAKKMEMRQLEYERIVKRLAKRLFERFGIKNTEIEVTFPEIITQDRSAKLKDLALCETQEWISKSRAASIAAKELGVSDFDYETELLDIKSDPPMIIPANPLTGPPQLSPQPTQKPEPETDTSSPRSDGFNSTDKHDLRMGLGA